MIESTAIVPQELEQENNILPVLRQLNKDFGDVLIEEQSIFEFDEFNSFLEYVERVFSGLLETNAERFFQLMYRIDLNEIEVKEILFNPKQINPMRIISGMILVREYEKILWRRKFSN